MKPEALQRMFTGALLRAISRNISKLDVSLHGNRWTAPLASGFIDMWLFDYNITLLQENTLWLICLNLH